LWSENRVETGFRLRSSNARCGGSGHCLVPATRTFCWRPGLGNDGVDLVAMNEVFAAQAIAVGRIAFVHHEKPFGSRIGRTVSVGQVAETKGMPPISI